MDKSFLILMHEFAAQKINTGFTRQELIDYLTEEGISLDNVWGDEKLEFLTSDIVYTRSASGGDVYFIAPEAYYRHMGYLEMKSAQENAATASRQANKAIFISIAFASIQIIISVTQFFVDKP